MRVGQEHEIQDIDRDLSKLHKDKWFNCKSRRRWRHTAEEDLVLSLFISFNYAHLKWALNQIFLLNIFSSLLGSSLSLSFCCFIYIYGVTNLKILVWHFRHLYGGEEEEEFRLAYLFQPLSFSLIYTKRLSMWMAVYVRFEIIFHLKKCK